MQRFLKSCLISLLLGLPLTGCGQTGPYNGFEVSDALIPAAEIHSGGPDRDGIPAIDDPIFLAAAKANLGDMAQVLGLALDEEARAYPIAIMN